MPLGNTVVFLSNPFEHPIVSRLMINLRESLRCHSRQIYIVYHNPVCHNLIMQYNFLEVISVTGLYAIYKSKLPTPIDERSRLRNS
jgi:hypothetical protein